MEYGRGGNTTTLMGATTAGESISSDVVEGEREGSKNKRGGVGPTRDGVCVETETRYRRPRDQNIRGGDACTLSTPSWSTALFPKKSR